jgi:hypothetical protein
MLLQPLQQVLLLLLLLLLLVLGMLEMLLLLLLLVLSLRLPRQRRAGLQRKQASAETGRQDACVAFSRIVRACMGYSGTCQLLRTSVSPRHAVHYTLGADMGDVLS